MAKKDDNPGTDHELDIAKKMSSGELTSPQRYENITLFALRISGTGVSYRRKLDEFVWRNPEIYLTDEFLARCNGLPVIWIHPVANILNSKEFEERIVGTIFLPYINGDEVWGIAKIYDDAAAKIMQDEKLSTSPSVVFRDPDVNNTIELEDGSHLLIEGKPSLLDHLAIVEAGVWDKGGEPSGVKSDSTDNGGVMTPEELKAKEAKEKSDADAKAKADADEKEAKEKEEKEKADSASALKSIADSVGALCKRMDAIEGKKPEDVEAAKTAADKARKDKADADEKEAKEKADAAIKLAADADISTRIKNLEANLPATLSDADRHAMADVQARADSVYSAFGRSAPQPMQGENLLSYRKRLAGEFKQHCKELGAVDLAAINDSAALEFFEKKIYADAMEAANRPVAGSDDMLTESISTDRAGRRISTFFGKPKAWMRHFQPPKQYLSAITKPN